MVMLPVHAGNGSKWASILELSQFRLRWGEFTRRDHIIKSYAIVTAIAKRLIGGLAAAAEGNDGAAGEAERGTRGVEDFELAFNADGTIGGDGDFGGWHPTTIPQVARYFFLVGVVLEPATGGVVGGVLSSTTSPNLMVERPSYFL